MTDSKSMSMDAGVPGSQSASTYIRWGGLAAVVGPILVLIANLYDVWRNFGSGPEGVVEAAMTTPYVVFGGARLLGGVVLVFGLVALYLYQIEPASRLGLVGFVIGMVGTVLLTASAWYQLFVVPAMAAEVPAFTEAVRAAEGGTVLTLGLAIPLLAQTVGWILFGVATYRASVFPRWAAVGLVVGAVLLLVPIPGIPIVFQLAVASMGFLLFSGRVETPAQASKADRSQSDSIGS